MDVNRRALSWAIREVGLTGLFVRRRVRGEVENGALASLGSTKQRLERAR